MSLLEDISLGLVQAEFDVRGQTRKGVVLWVIRALVLKERAVRARHGGLGCHAGTTCGPFHRWTEERTPWSTRERGPAMWSTSQAPSRCQAGCPSASPDLHNSPLPEVPVFSSV